MKKSSKRFMSLAVSAVLVAPIFLASVPPVIYAQDNVSAISSQQVLNLSQVKQLTKGSKVTTQGVVVNPPGSWGGTGFYLQDSTGGLYVYPGKGSTVNVKPGDEVKVSATLGEFNGEKQLGGSTTIEVIRSNQTIPQTVLSQVGNLTNEDIGRNLSLQSMQVANKGDITTENNGSKRLEFELVDSNRKSLRVYLNNRSGIDMEKVSQELQNNDVINIRGVLAYYKGLQLKPFAQDFYTVVKKAQDNTNPTTPAEDVVKVGQIQGAQHTSPMEGKHVAVKDVVVTAVEGSTRFYVQDLHPDGDDKTSDGVNVFKQNHKVKVGDKLELTGQVVEYNGQGYAERKETDLTITQLKADEVKKVGQAEVPAPIVLGVDRKVPDQTIENDGFKDFDPQEDALDFWESVEGMNVAVNEAKILGPQKNGDLYVLPNESKDTLNKSGGLLLDEDYNPQLIVLATGDKKLRAKAKDRVVGQVAGPVTYSYGMYKIYLPKGSVKIQDGNLGREKTTIVPAEDKLTIASYNIENFSANPSSTNDEKVNRIATSLVSDLHTPDLINLLEMQDNDGATDSGTTDATLSAKRLIDQIKAVGGPEYRYVDIAPENNQDGGAPGANIRVGFLYNPERVTFVKAQAIGKDNPIFKNTRKSLAGFFKFKDQDILLVGNHLNSKRGDQPLYGKNQPVVFGSETQRHELASAISAFVDEQIKANNKLNVVMTGDFNDFEFSRTLQILEGNQLTNLVKNHPAEDRYSYFYQGNAQTLDHLLVSNRLVKNATFDMVHINAMFMVEDGRASDHDPVMVQLSFTNDEPTEPSTPGDDTNTTPDNGNPQEPNQEPNTTRKAVLSRLYNPNSGEHFFTIDTQEASHLASLGWRLELQEAVVPESSEHPVYRAYNPNNGDHHYTMNKAEIDHLVKVGWRAEGIAWYSADATMGKPVYRLYNPNAKVGSHHLTPILSERDYLVSLGWHAEGVTYYQLAD